MSTSGNTPIHSKPFDPFEKYYRIEGLEPARDEGNSSGLEEPQKNQSLFAFLIWSFKRMIDQILQRQKNLLSEEASQELLFHLKAFLKALNRLSKEDISQNSLFLQELSIHWQKILEISLLFKQASSFAIGVKGFIRELASYPPGAEFSLAYYLTEYAGQSWIPLPYLEMLKELFVLYRQDPLKSPLQRWIESLEQTIASLQ